MTRAKVFTIDHGQTFPVRLFVPGYEYRLFGLFPARLHLLGVDAPGVLFPFGTDSLGRDMLTRVLHGARISLSIGLVGVTLSFLLGCLLGGLSGFFGGPVDMLVQRTIEFLQALPTIPLWMALAAAVPIEWPALRVYFMITVILSVIGWTGLARVVRGKLLHAAHRGLRDRGRHRRRQLDGDHPAPPAARLHELPDRPPDAGDPVHDPG